MSDQLLDVLSEINEDTGNPYLDTCTLVVGDGTVRVNFVKGRAKVPADRAGLLTHPHVRVIGAPDTPAEAAHFDDGPIPITGPRKPVETVVKRQPTEEDLELAREVLAAEGLEVPDPEPTGEQPEVRPGFEAVTSEGQPRCQAAKNDGGQCANAATDGRACAIAKHREQLA